MKLTNLALSEKLYELTKWETGSTGFCYYNGTPVWGHIPGATPAYDTGFLIDMLTEKKTGLTLYHVHSTMQYEAFYAGKFFEYGTDTQHWDYQSNNPADSLALLAIDLLKKGVIKP